MKIIDDTNPTMVWCVRPNDPRQTVSPPERPPPDRAPARTTEWSGRCRAGNGRAGVGLGKVGRVGKFLLLLRDFFRAVSREGLALTVLLVLLGCQSQPVEQSNSALEMVSSPWVGCDIGSFVHYRILMTAGNFVEEKQTVLEIRRNQVILEVSRLGNNDEWEHKNMVIVPLKVMGRPEKTIKVTEDTITIKGKLLKCKVEKQVGYDTEHGNKKIVMQTWMSDDVPGGVVRISHNDKIAVEVVDFEKK